MHLMVMLSIEVLRGTIKEEKPHTKITKGHSLYLGVVGMVAKAWTWGESQISCSLASVTLKYM